VARATLPRSRDGAHELRSALRISEARRPSFTPSSAGDRGVARPCAGAPAAARGRSTRAR